MEKELRDIFLDELRKSFKLYNDGDKGKIDFIGSLAERNKIFWDFYKIDDISLNSAATFCDYFFDASYNDFSECEGIPMDEAKEMVQSIIDTFSAGKDINDKKILDFYSKKKK